MDFSSIGIINRPANTSKAGDISRSEILHDGIDDFVGKDSEVAQSFWSAIPEPVNRCRRSRIIHLCSLLEGIKCWQILCRTRELGIEPI